MFASPSADDRRAAVALATTDRCSLGWELLRQGNRELARLRATRGAYRRTARRIARVMAVLALAASLLGMPLATSASADEPCFWQGAGLPDKGYSAATAFGDIDGDGDLDAYLSGYFGGYYLSGATIFFENQGTATFPSLEDKVYVPGADLAS